MNKNYENDYVNQDIKQQIARGCAIAYDAPSIYFIKKDEEN